MQEIREYAPILIPTLSRYIHFRRCVESLSKCTHAEKTELVIGLDYPPVEKYREGWEKISEFITTIKGFKKVTILRTETNLGAIANSRRIREYIQDKSQTYIYSEDDNEFSPCFLDYINKALARYWDDERITSVSGYNYPVDMSGYDKSVYAYHQYSAWGVGRWVHKFDYVPNSYAKEVLSSPLKMVKILKTEPKVLFILMSMVARKQRWGDTLTVASNILKERYSIFPSISLCRNYGHDGSGLHCGGNEVDGNELFKNQIISMNKTFELDEVEIIDADIPALKEYFAISTIEALSDLKQYIMSMGSR